MEEYIPAEIRQYPKKALYMFMTLCYKIYIIC